jgi:transposase-like protein
MKIAEFMRRFPDDKSCRQHLESVRWPDGPVCPSCGVVNNAVPVATRRPGVYRCRDCNHQFSVTVGTAMEGTHLPLNVWYHAMYLILASSKGISTLNLSKQLGLQYRTVWHLCHRIRAMLESGDKTPLTGLIEADETYVGGKPRNLRNPAPRPTRGRGTPKPMMFAAVERGGRARTAVVRSASAEAIDPLLFAWLNRDGVLATDELAVYQWFGGKMRRHVTVNHNRREFARWDRGVHAHTNTCESFFGLFKRAIVGVWHWISAKHLHRYGVEREFRWNTRKADVETRIANALIGQHGRLRLRELFA